MKNFSLYVKPDHLSVTGGLTKFARCPRKFFFSHGLGLEEMETPALRFGSALHVALPLAHLKSLEEAIAAFMKSWGDTAGDEKRNPMTAIAILTHYHKTHSQGRAIFEPMLPPSGIPHVDEKDSIYEIPFALHIGLSRPFVGLADGLCKHRDTGELWGLEYKTTAELSSRFLDCFQLNPQIIATTRALRSYGIPVKGTILEGIKVSIAKTNAQDEMLTPVLVTDEMITDFLAWAKWIDGCITACESSGDFPKDLSGCTSYSQFGSAGYQCGFQPMCLVGESWPQLLGMFGRRTERSFSTE